MALNTPAGTLPPLLLAMENSSFTESVRQHSDAASDSTLRRFVREARRVATYRDEGDRDERINALDKQPIGRVTVITRRTGQRQIRASIAASVRLERVWAPTPSG